MGAAATRQQIVDAADRLFYTRGFDATSFADIAAEVGLSRGNFYYHFRTKDEILRAVIAQRLSRTREMLESWDAAAEAPQDRLRRFIGILSMNRAAILAHGCPIGTLCAELAKLDHLARPDAAALFALFRDWMTRQFTALGCGEAAEALSLHLLMRSQGIAALALAFGDEEFLRRETLAMERWLEAQGPGPRTPSETPHPH
ncbi:TetR/AcrR family transcriptional regulator [Roseomonas sp. OT10]|uniref:TetR/AcrR family transcriptional regulator n=1 Tax=Roseomonas cutis TaxID=2897332 RepID=UPI001E322089|nr:TetR/AcrR family transcriptional regulator [Roseomonas sp. OT10]UFN48212.1 TetR/AcrR family transcriptional regulator [Roseomonas sp. OT10]